ncbi:MAG TPA: gluconate kinase [Phycisphaerales bacterium]|nr:gluconate kinase [Phycisphaerales bacterium]HCD33102.1 gluconate kinase [Phycisphaerales bacterium]|tara:strand:- start:12 stop:497 length:486 start_codon:yes stop_codon:yes gene_type:complete
MHIIVMGVSGVGKTAVGQQLARALHLRFDDADDFHPAMNVEKMQAGIPLTDKDRWPWLDILNHHLKQTAGCVLACSALKAAYRMRLCQGAEDVRLVYLKADRDTLIQRMQQREHFMPTSLLESQLQTWEDPTATEPWPVVTVDATLPLDEVVSQLVAALSM